MSSIYGAYAAADKPVEAKLAADHDEDSIAVQERFLAACVVPAERVLLPAGSLSLQAVQDAARTAALAHGVITSAQLADVLADLAPAAVAACGERLHSLQDVLQLMRREEPARARSVYGSALYDVRTAGDAVASVAAPGAGDSKAVARPSRESSDSSSGSSSSSWSPLAPLPPPLSRSETALTTAAFSSDFRWAQRFAAALEMQDSPAKYRVLSELGTDFKQAATTYVHGLI